MTHDRITIKSTRTVLIATLYFPPCAGSGVFRMLGLVRHLPTFHWQTMVVAPPKMPWEPEDHELLNRIPPETIVRRARYPHGRVWNMLKLGAAYERWLPHAMPVCGRLIAHQRPDAVLTSGPPHAVHLLGMWLKRRHGLPWVADFRDPWIAGGWQRRGLRRRWEPYLERMVMRHADVVVANAPRACASLQAAFPDCRDKMISIANGFDPGDFSSGKEPAARNGSTEVSRTVRIVHTGDLYFRRDPRALLDAVQRLDATADGDRTPLKLRFVGQTHDLDVEVRRRDMESLVEILPHVEYRQSQAEMTRADVLLLIDAPGRRTGVPAKLYEYLGAGRPILALAEPDGDTAWVLRESGAEHRLVRSDDAAGIQTSLAELVEVSRRADARRTDAGSLSQFTREHMAQLLAEALDRLVGLPDATEAVAARAEIDREEFEHVRHDRETALN